MIVSPIDFLKANLDPISAKIDSFGGYNLMCGLIAANGQPHVYIIGNLNGTPTLAREIYTELGNKLLDLGRGGSQPQSLVISPGAM